jgi:hypothetical protein
MGAVELTNNQWVWEIFCILVALVILLLTLAPKE